MEKAMEIRELVELILEIPPEPKQGPMSRKESNEESLRISCLEDHIEAVRECIGTIQRKIPEAEKMHSYELRMQCAADIRGMAVELRGGLFWLEIFGYDEPRYFDMVLQEIEEFRKLFLLWVQAFDKRHFTYDEWGMFNPPGAIGNALLSDHSGPDGPDPDDPEDGSGDQPPH